MVGPYVNEPSPFVIRCERRWAVILAHLIWSPLLVAAFLLGAALWNLLLVAEPVEKLLAIPYVSLAFVILYQLDREYHWIEFDGKTLRARGFWYRRIAAWQVEQIDSVSPLFRRNSLLKDSSPHQVLDAIEGFEIRFRNRHPLVTITRFEFTYVPELCLFLLKEIRPQDPAP